MYIEIYDELTKKPLMAIQVFIMWFYDYIAINKDNLDRNKEYSCKCSPFFIEWHFNN